MLGLSISTPRYRHLGKECRVALLIIKNCEQPNSHKSRIVNNGGIFTQCNTKQHNGKHFPGTCKNVEESSKQHVE